MPILRNHWDICRILSIPLGVPGWPVHNWCNITVPPNQPNAQIYVHFFGLVNQLSSSTNIIATLLTPLSPLLSTNNEFLWNKNHKEAFVAAKKALITTPILSFFWCQQAHLCMYRCKPTRIWFCFVAAEQWDLIQAGSRFLIDAKARYAVTELEMLAVCWAIQKCKLFLTGLQHFSVITDHNLLIQIINTHRLDEIENCHLQQLKTRLMSYNCTATWEKDARMIPLMPCPRTK